eukprot:jgi/Mesen1/1449/ME000132S00395
MVENEEDTADMAHHMQDQANQEVPREKGRKRLIIKEMVMENFKSYAGAQRVGPFHKSFSSVVGPNGSGKSNVIDAMLFVFGKRAKQLRLNKVSELIHNSTHHQNLPMAQVTVYFEEIIDVDDENMEVVPNSAFTIARAAYRDNTSKYFVNGRGSSFTEVTKILKGKGVDLDNNRFLILQGEVEQIAMMKPKAQNANDTELLEYLEDIVGTNCYVERIEEGEKLVEEANDKRVSVIQRVKLVEGEKNKLEGAKKEAEAYMLKEAEIIRWRIVACQLALREGSALASADEERVGELEKSLESERAKCVGFREELAVLQKEYDAHHKDHEDTEKLKELVSQSEGAEAAIPELEAKLAKLNEQLAVEDKQLESLQESIRGEVQGYQAELSEARKELEPWDKRINECKAQIEHKDAMKRLEEAQQAGKDKAQAAEEKDRQVAAMSAAVTKHASAASEGRREEEECAERESGMEAPLQAARSKLTEVRDALNSEKTQNSIAQALMAAKASGALPGIYGRLGDLGAIDAKYDVAISTACGALDYILVDSGATAQACVELLRAKSLGVATFIMLDKQQGLVGAMREAVRTPEGVPRLFDLVRVRDEALLPAFFYALRHTVVANDLNQGTRIAYGPDKKFKRVVTLEGALFESSGTMAGGGGKPRGGKMGTSVRASGGASRDALSACERQLAELTAEMQAVQRQRQAAGEKREAAEAALAELEMKIPKTQMEVKALRQQVAELEQRLGSLRAAAQPSADEEARVAELCAAVAAHESALAELVESSSQLRKRAEAIQKQIDGAGGERLKKKKAQVAKLQADIDASDTEANQCRVRLAANAKQIPKLTRAREEAEREAERERAALQAVKDSMRELENGAFAVSDSFNKVQNVSNPALRALSPAPCLCLVPSAPWVLREKEEALDAIKARHVELQKTVNEFSKGEVEVEIQLENLRKAARVHGERASKLAQKLADLRKMRADHVQQMRADGLEEGAVKAALRDAPVKKEQQQQQEQEKQEQEGEQQQQQEEEEEEEEGGGVSREAAEAKCAQLEEQRKAMNPNLASIAEYRKKVAEYGARVKDLDAVTEERDSMRRQTDELKKQRAAGLRAGFSPFLFALDVSLAPARPPARLRHMITLGGDAELELVDSLDPFSEGIVFSVRPPKKSWKNIANLSGGEKTLSSLALVFALHHYKPTPLYVMDEIDAALDFKNVSIVAHYIKDRTKDAQFIIISLRNNMFELADRLVGIYKTDNCTKSITINPGSFAIASTAS